MTWNVLPWLGVREWGPVKHSGNEETSKASVLNTTEAWKGFWRG